MRKILLLAIILSSSVSSVSAKESEVSGVMAAAKFSGGCGIFRQMFIFQESTQMPGGEDFIMRFLNTETARLGYSQEEYFEICKKSTEMYKEIVKLDNQDSQK